MSEIKPKYIDGEPMCSGEECSRWGFGNTDDPQNRTCFRSNSPCIPALRRDRDKLEAELAECKRSELIAVKAMTYLAGKLSNKDKLSPQWIKEALEIVEKTK